MLTWAASLASCNQAAQDRVDRAAMIVAIVGHAVAASGLVVILAFALWSVRRVRRQPGRTSTGLALGAGVAASGLGLGGAWVATTLANESEPTWLVASWAAYAGVGIVASAIGFLSPLRARRPTR